MSVDVEGDVNDDASIDVEIKDAPVEVEVECASVEVEVVSSIKFDKIV